MNFPKCANCCSLFWLFVFCVCLSSFANCDEVVCDDQPPQISNAQPELQGLRPPFHNGTNITYNCIDGYVPHPGANLYVVCVADNETASWIYDENVLCTLVCGDLPHIPHATLKPEGKSPPFHPGVKIHIECDPGYLTGGTVLQVECVLNQGSAVWKLPERSCSPRSCGHPGDIENAELKSHLFTYPNNVTYTCKEGFKMKGKGTIFCMASGHWFPSLPSCEAIICPQLTHPQNGRVISTDTHFGTIATYECDRGFRLEGTSQRTCGADSQWTGHPPTCTVVTCPHPGDLENGRIIGGGINVTYNSGYILIYKCSFSTESRSSKCLESGHWSSRMPSCPGPPTYTPKTDTPPFDVIASTKTPTNSSEHINAATGTISPTTKVSSNSSGFQNEDKCEDPGSIPNGKRTANVFTPGSNVTYTCEDGYDLRGKGTLICLGTGKWDLEKLPICVKQIPTTVIVGVVVGLILLGVTGIIVFFVYRGKVNSPKGYGKKSKALATDASDQEEIARLDKGKKPIPVTVL